MLEQSSQDIKNEDSCPAVQIIQPTAEMIAGTTASKAERRPTVSGTIAVTTAHTATKAQGSDHVNKSVQPNTSRGAIDSSLESTSIRANGQWRWQL